MGVETASISASVCVLARVLAVPPGTLGFTYEWVGNSQTIMRKQDCLMTKDQNELIIQELIIRFFNEYKN